MKQLYRTYYDSPIGLLEITGTEQGITGVHFVEKKSDPDPAIPVPLKNCCRQLYEYFVGGRKEFSLKLLLDGTNFQKKLNYKPLPLLHLRIPTALETHPNSSGIKPPPHSQFQF